MEKPDFEKIVKELTAVDRQFDPDGYLFVRNALKQTLDKLREDELIEHSHISGPELLNGIVEHALSEYGVMAATVLDSWGIKTGEDIGQLVFKLIEAGAFGKSEEDRQDDFSGVIDLKEELTRPFRPTRRVIRSVASSDSGEGDPPARENQPAKPTGI